MLFIRTIVTLTPSGNLSTTLEMTHIGVTKSAGVYVHHAERNAIIAADLAAQGELAAGPHPYAAITTQASIEAIMADGYKRVHIVDVGEEVGRWADWLDEVCEEADAREKIGGPECGEAFSTAEALDFIEHVEAHDVEALREAV